MVVRNRKKKKERQKEGEKIRISEAGKKDGQEQRLKDRYVE